MAIALPLAGGRPSSGATPPAGLALDVQSEDAWGKAKDEFAINETAWLTYVVRNTSPTPVTLYVDQGQDGGAECRVTEGHERAASVVRREGDMDQSFMTDVARPGQRLTLAKVPLSDFLRVIATGSLPLDCSIELLDEHEKPVSLKASVRVKFNTRLDDAATEDLVGRLRKAYDSGDEATRTRMVRSALCLPSPATFRLLARAISDKSDYVQFSALDVLSRINAPKEQTLPLIREAAKSDRESVRLRAAWAERQLNTSPK
jgi:hypothetical protein